MVKLWFRDSATMGARHFSIRFSFCYALLMIGAGVQLPFLPLWMHAQGLDSGQIASILACMMISRAFASPLIAYVADRLGARVPVIRTCTTVTFCAYFLLAQMSGYISILLAACLTSLAFAAVFPLTESYSINSSAKLGLDYGRLRLWASLSFLSGGLAAGYALTFVDASSAIWMIVAGQAFALIASFILPPDPSQENHVHPEALKGESAKRLLFGSQFTLVLIAVSLGQSSHALVNGFGTVYWTDIGFSTFQVGLLWTAAILTEVLLFAFSGRIVAAVGFERLIYIGLGAGVVRWTIMPFVSGFGWSIPVQMLHALTFAALHLGTMHFIREAIPARLQNTAQGLYGAVASGIFMALVTRLSGDIFDGYGGYAFLFMACVSALALVHAVFSFRVIPKVRDRAGSKGLGHMPARDRSPG
jgi:MFS transporter, PPP family, 3-phenylpropionic acid transporter